jgi:hypothetical protein
MRIDLCPVDQEMTRIARRCRPEALDVEVVVFLTEIKEETLRLCLQAHKG